MNLDNVLNMYNNSCKSYKDKLKLKNDLHFIITQKNHWFDKYLAFKLIRNINILLFPFLIINKMKLYN